MRIITILCGIILALTGIFALANPGATFLSMAFIIGIVMVFYGVVLFSGYIIGRVGSENENHSWILTDSIITIFIGVIILANQLSAEAAIPLVFGLWLMYSGVLRIVAATYIDRILKPKNFYSALLIGILLVLAGVYSFINPVFAAISLMGLIGIFFIVQGIATLELGINMPHRKKEKI